VAIAKPTPKNLDTRLEQLVKDQVQRNNDSERNMEDIRELVDQMRITFDAKKPDVRILGFAAFEDWIANRVSLRELLGSNWRVELLNQYMYLISAPFLAIVAYLYAGFAGLSQATRRSPHVLLRGSHFGEDLDLDPEHGDGLLEERFHR
jgi:hypothetical protein